MFKKIDDFSPSSHHQILLLTRTLLYCHRFLQVYFCINYILLSFCYCLNLIPLFSICFQVHFSFLLYISKFLIFSDISRVLGRPLHHFGCNPSLASLEDISPAQIYHADLTSIVFFLLSFVAIYSLNKTYISSF